MALPISGLLSKSEIVYGPPTILGYKPVWIEGQRYWYRQAKPYDLPLAFSYRKKQVLSSYSIGNDSYATTSDCLNFPGTTTSSLFPEVYNKAYERFRSRIMSSNAGLGINLAQRRQAVEMIGKRCDQITRFVGHLRRFRFAKAAHTLGLGNAPKGLKKKGKAFADNFLEYHFGWSPLIGDIGSAVDVLQDGVPPARVRVQASGQKLGKSYIPLTDGEIYYLADEKCIWIIGGNIFVSNPNLHLADQLGLLNPATIAWDAIPFSFVVGWFVNVEAFLNSFTDFAGLSFEKSYTSSYYVGHLHRQDWMNNYQPDRTKPPQRVMTYSFNTSTVQHLRNPGGIPGPSLQFNAPWRVSPMRGLTAVSLLLQRLGG